MIFDALHQDFVVFTFVQNHLFRTIPLDRGERPIINNTYRVRALYIFCSVVGPRKCIPNCYRTVPVRIHMNNLVSLNSVLLFVQ